MQNISIKEEKLKNKNIPYLIQIKLDIRFCRIETESWFLISNNQTSGSIQYRILNALIVTAMISNPYFIFPPTLNSNFKPQIVYHFHLLTHSTSSINTNLYIFTYTRSARLDAARKGEQVSVSFNLNYSINCLHLERLLSGVAHCTVEYRIRTISLAIK